MSGPPRASNSSPPSTSIPSGEGKQWEYKDCISCKIVGTGALGLTGLYAVRMVRPRAPGSVFGKIMMAGIGVGFLAGSVVRWNMTPTEMLGTFADQFVSYFPSGIISNMVTVQIVFACESPQQ